MRMKQPIGKTYSQMIKFGRLLENYSRATEMANDAPEIIFSFVENIDRQLLWTSTEDFFSVFTPIKRYADDGRWDYHSTMGMRRERLGTHFGKDDFKHLIMSDCFNNKYLPLIGFAFMCSITRLHERQTGGNLIQDFLSNQKTMNK